MPTEHIAHIAVKINGADIPTDLLDDLDEATIDTSLHLPDMFVLRFHDEDLKWVDDDLFTPGASVEIGFSEGAEAFTTVMKGEITAVEPHFAADLAPSLTVRGYDRSHRLNRAPKTRVFHEVTDSDIVKTIAGEANLQADIEATSQVREHVYQDNRTDLDFLHELAERNGREVFVDGRKLVFRKPEGKRGDLRLEWGEELRGFHPRLTLAHQVDEVVVRGWDETTKREVSGQARRSETAPQVGAKDFGQGAFGSTREVVVRYPVTTQAAATDLAQAILDDLNGHLIEAQGTAEGHPQLVAGVTLDVDKVGQRFSGNYVVTSATHIYSMAVGYEVDFKVEGARPTLMADLVAPQAQSNGWGGVVPAVVTNNKDPKKMGRVKVKYPWLDNDLESGWARMSGVGAGAERGVFWLPEVNDEVLVAFEHGDFDRPYVLGGLWNGKDAPPEQSPVASGKVHTRTIQTRTGHVIRLVDDNGNNQFIEIQDSAQGTHIKLDARSNELIITCKGDVKINADRTIALKAQQDLSIEAGGTLALKGRTVDLNGQLETAVQGGTSLTLKGTQLVAEGTGTAQFKSSGDLSIRGTIVRIN